MRYAASLIAGWLLASGCCASLHHRHVGMPGAGCTNAQVDVGPGCYTQPIPEGIEVRCADGRNTKYTCTTPVRPSGEANDMDDLDPYWLEPDYYYVTPNPPAKTPPRNLPDSAH
jgi:hypothetical protein